MFEKIRNRQATTKHLYVKRPAYTITEEELAELEKGSMRFKVVRGAIERGNLAQARIWCGLSAHDAQEIDDELRSEIKAALEGDSNDAEHDALAAVAMTLGIEYRDPDDVLEDS